MVLKVLNKLFIIISVSYVISEKEVKTDNILKILSHMVALLF